MTSNSTTNTQITPDKLRTDFIGMAFALAIGEIGLEIGRLYDKGVRLRDHWYLIAHIVLSVYIIASSWIGWNRSKSKGNQEKVKDAFSVPFAILLIDLYLVICYFIIVQSIGKDPLIPDCRNQVYWSIMIFGTYIIWDFFSKFIIEDDVTLKFRIINTKQERKEYFNRFYQAPICLLITYFIVRPISLDNRPLNIVSKDTIVLCADIILILVFVLFRGMKGFENRPSKVPLYIFLPSILIVLTYGYYKLYI